jgi:hypothetical protein
MEMSIAFDASNCPKNMFRLYHILIDGGVALNLISLESF